MRALPLEIGVIHFIGIGGIGMSGIAEVMHNLGYQVQGSDQAENVNVKRLQNLGIQVKYLAFPRAGIDSDSFNKIASAWCSLEPNKAITELKLGNEIKENICLNNPVEKHFNLGNNLGVSGTPSIITSEGKLIPGYISPEELIGLLNS